MTCNCMRSDRNCSKCRSCNPHLTPEEEAKNIAKYMGELLKEPGAKKRCREFLISTGIYNKDGNLSEDYK